MLDLDEHLQWIGHAPTLPAPTPPVATEDGEATLLGGWGTFGPSESASLRLELGIAGPDSQIKYDFEIFPDTAGVRMWVKESGNPPMAATPTSAARSQQPNEDALERFDITQPHLLFTQVTLQDRTDRHGELAAEYHWLLQTNESLLTLKGNLFVIENNLTGNGLVFLKEAPLPQARPVDPSYDAWVSSSHMGVSDSSSTVPQTYFSVSFYGNDFSGDGVGDPWITIAYHGGRTGRINALHRYQRQLHTYVPQRDGLFLTNTWGDRAGGLNIDESFIRREIDAAKKLGVDVVQVDAGWQTGSTSRTPGRDESYWVSNAHFWDPNPARLPRGLAGSASYAHSLGIKLGLWFSPDSYDDFVHWSWDANRLLELVRHDGVDSFKLDMLSIRSRLGEERFRSLLDKLQQQTQGRLLLDLDITADARLGYFGDIAAGSMFVENRYTDSHRYWPHQTLRALWELAQYVDPLRLRMEFLNPERKTELYANDPLAPSQYTPDCLFATTMMSSPLGWFENTGLSAHFVSEAAPIIATWKRERESMQRDSVIPIGAEPDGLAWTGFAAIRPNELGGYLLLFRELNETRSWTLPPDLFPLKNYKVIPLGGEGTVFSDAGGLHAIIPKRLGFVWVRLEPTS